MKTHFFVLICLATLSFASCKKETTKPDSNPPAVEKDDSLDVFSANVNGTPFTFITLGFSQYMSNVTMYGEDGNGSLRIFLQSPATGQTYNVAQSGPNRIMYTNYTDTFYCATGTIEVVKFVPGSVFKGRFSGTGPVTITNGEFNSTQ